MRFLPLGAWILFGAQVVAQTPEAKVFGTHGMVVSSSSAATEAGLAVLKEGGTAVDAAVATFFALSVTYPAAGNIGGGGFVVMRLADGRELAIDFRETAPVAATTERFHDKEGRYIPERSKVGGLAAGVPGSVAGMHHVLKNFGTIAWPKALAPAVKLARDGFVLPSATRRGIAAKSTRELFAPFPASVAAFLTPLEALPLDGKFKQPDLAATLQRIADGGPDVFYKGEIADLIVAEMARTGGAMTKEDLAAYQVKERPVLAGNYRGHRIVTMPPPSSGGVALLQMLGMMEMRDARSFPYRGEAEAHLEAEIMKRAFYDRATWLGDPDFVKVPVKGMLSKEHLEAMLKSLGERATPATALGIADPPMGEKLETTHFAVVDDKGNAVACTTTLNGGFGCGVTVTGAGFLLNNEMDDFGVSPGKPNMFGLIQGPANRIEPRKRPLSSMTPTLVLKDGRVILVAGSPGGPTIINTVHQMIVNVLDRGMTAAAAVAAPRLHHQWMPDELLVEQGGLTPEVVAALRKRGHTVRFRGTPEKPTYQGDGHLIYWNGTAREGAADPRHEGQALGY